ncbi:hypothetical protein AALO_G00220790 [Alosa alosa]|uniref:Uncharacterized protein n=1 Tax=Alosa alosa TaxID=278164 RepID=A0AAV6G416_9TELE|nr:hypothetical protein AALO_G00220790 [Alosa alosa]
MELPLNSSLSDALQPSIKEERFTASTVGTVVVLIGRVDLRSSAGARRCFSTSAGTTTHRSEKATKTQSNQGNLSQKRASAF